MWKLFPRDLLVDSRPLTPRRSLNKSKLRRATSLLHVSLQNQTTNASLHPNATAENTLWLSRQAATEAGSRRVTYPRRGDARRVCTLAVAACEVEHLHRLLEGFVVLGCDEGQHLSGQRDSTNILCRIRTFWEVKVLGVFHNSHAVARAARGGPALRFLLLTGGRLF